MSTNIAEIRDPAMSGSEGAIPFRADAMAERFREQCRRRLDTEPATAPQPVRRLDGICGQDPDDPAISAIDEWRAARQAYLARRCEIEPLWDGVPDWVRNWRGVYAGRVERPDGGAVPVHARTEAELNEWYDRRVRRAPSPAAARRIERQRRVALAELRLTLAAEKGACRAAGLPFDRDLEDDYWRDYRDRIARAESAVESIPAKSAQAIEARCRHAARLIEDLEDGRGDADLARHVRSVILRIGADVAGIGGG